MCKVENDPRFNTALQFLKEGLKTNKNPKPVGEHSINIANILLKYGYDETIINAALLHDLVEDTDVTLDEIEKQFGELVRNLVDSMSYDIPGNNYEKKYDLFIKSKEHIKSLGPDAVVLDAADFIDNSYYYKLAETEELKEYLKKKYEYFMDLAEPFLKGSKIWEEFMDCYLKNARDLI